MGEWPMEFHRSLMYGLRTPGRWPGLSYLDPLGLGRWHGLPRAMPWAIIFRPFGPGGSRLWALAGGSGDGSRAFPPRVCVAQNGAEAPRHGRAAEAMRSGKGESHAEPLQESIAGRGVWPNGATM